MFKKKIYNLTGLDMQKGLAEGEKRKALETARKMREKGFSAEEICGLTGLDAQELANHLKPA